MVWFVTATISSWAWERDPSRDFPEWLMEAVRRRKKCLPALTKINIGNYKWFPEWRLILVWFPRRIKREAYLIILGSLSQSVTSNQIGSKGQLLEPILQNVTGKNTCFLHFIPTSKIYWKQLNCVLQGFSTSEGFIGLCFNSSKNTRISLLEMFHRIGFSIKIP